MTLTELKTLLSNSNIPVYYAHVKESESLPFIVYNVAYSHNFKADNKVFQKYNHIDLYLYTQNKDETKEQTLETIFENNSIVWSKSESYLNEQEVFEIFYEIEI